MLSIVFKFPRPFTIIGLADVDGLDVEGTSIFIGLLRYGELIPILAGAVVIVEVAVEAAEVIIFSAKVAAVSRSLPPPLKMK